MNKRGTVNISFFPNFENPLNTTTNFLLPTLERGRKSQEIGTNFQILKLCDPICNNVKYLAYGVASFNATSQAETRSNKLFFLLYWMTSLAR